MDDLQQIEKEAHWRALNHLTRRPVYFAQVPVEMLKALHSKGKPQEVFLYLLLHSYSSEKSLRDIPEVQVSEITLARDMGIDENNVRRWLKSMEGKGWIRSIRDGNKIPNSYLLYPVGKSNLEGRVRMEKVQLRIQHDYELAKRLRESLHKVTI